LTHPTLSLLLFDVDGVLIHPAGYKAAIRATVGHFAEQMGLPDALAVYAPDEHEIAVFEACGITNEWDSGAICAGALLDAALEADPALGRPTLDATLAAIRAARLALDRPDYAALARSIPHVTADPTIVPAARYLEMLTGRGGDHLPLFAALLGDVYGLRAPTTRVFQAYVLGSALYASVYEEPAPLEHEGCIAAYDVPLLSIDARDRLQAWRAQPGHAMVIFTARPSLPPAGAARPHGNGFSPEAELALKLLGFDAPIPLIGQGRVGWLARQRGRNTADYTKPSPVQALAAIGAGVAGDECAALHAAAALVETGRLDGPLAALRDRTLSLTVFEDGIGGIRATLDAARLLQDAGVDVSARAIGVSPQTDKRAALGAVADHVVDDVNAGLALVWSD